MHFLPFVSTILATAVLVASEPSAQFDPFEIASSWGTLPADRSYDGEIAGKLTPQPAGTTTEVEGSPRVVPSRDTTAPGQLPAADPRTAPSPQPEQFRQQLPEGSTSPLPGYRGNQHCQDYGGCPFPCHEDCVCWEWCKDAKCSLAPFGEQALTSSQLSCDPSAGKLFIGKVCRPYCVNWCEDIKNQVLQSLTLVQEQRAFLSTPLECDHNAYYCPSDPNPRGLDCLTPSNPLAPGSSQQSTPSRSYRNQENPSRPPSNLVTPDSSNNKELDKSDASTNTGTTEFSLDF